MEHLMRAQKRMNSLVVATAAMNRFIANAINDEDTMTLKDLQDFSRKLSTVAEGTARDFEEAFKDIEKGVSTLAAKLAWEGRYE